MTFEEPVIDYEARVPPWALVAVICIQTVWFLGAVQLDRHGSLPPGHTNDTRRYQAPALSFLDGHGFSYAKAEYSDRELLRLLEEHHPQRRDDSHYPATTLPPGYSFFLIPILLIDPTDHAGPLAANWILVLATCAGPMYLLKRLAPRLAPFGFAIFAICPMFALYGSKLQTDILHAFLLVAFGLTWFRDDLRWKHALVGGILLGFAILVRPYTVLLPAFLLAVHLIRRRRRNGLGAHLVLLVVSWLILGTWVARNAYWFGKPMVTSMGLGQSLLAATYQYTDGNTTFTSWDEVPELRDVDPYDSSENRWLLEVAIDRIRARPMAYIGSSAARAIRLWIPQRPGGSRWQNLSMAAYCLSQLLLVGVGLRACWPLTSFAGQSALLVASYYWLVFIPLAVEARYMLAAWPFILCFAAIGGSKIVQAVARLRTQ